jgi:hypothetical protein
MFQRTRSRGISQTKSSPVESPTASSAPDGEKDIHPTYETNPRRVAAALMAAIGRAPSGVTNDSGAPSPAALVAAGPRISTVGDASPRLTRNVTVSSLGADPAPAASANRTPSSERASRG